MEKVQNVGTKSAFTQKKKKIYINFLTKGAAHALHVQPALV